MNHFLLTNIDEKNAKLLGQEAKHCNKVFRHQEGDEILCIDGIGNIFKTKIIQINNEIIDLEILTKQKQPKPLLTIAIAPCKKNESLEWMVEKLTEIGVAEIQFILSQRVERKNINIEKLQNIAKQACKQSGNAYIPLIHSFQKFKTWVAHEKNKNSNYYIGSMQKQDKTFHFEKNETLILIGPEGDFTPEEYNMAWKNGFQDVHLNRQILRSETAAIVAAACFAYQTL